MPTDTPHHARVGPRLRRRQPDPRRHPRRRSPFAARPAWTSSGSPTVSPVAPTVWSLPDYPNLPPSGRRTGKDRARPRAETPMKVFHCDHCGHLLFFENTQCVQLRPTRCLSAGSRARRLARSQRQIHEQMTLSPPGVRRSRRAGRLYRLCRELREGAGLQLGGPGSRSTYAVRLVPADTRHSRSDDGRAPSSVVPARGRKASPDLHAAAPASSDRQPRRRSGERPRVRVQVGCERHPVLTGHATGVITDQRRRGRRRRARAATHVAARAVSHARSATSVTRAATTTGIA